MSTALELTASIDEYTAQLKKVNDAIDLSETETEREALRALHDDLTELLHLTHETLAETGHRTATNQNAAAEAGDPLDDEFSQFMQEIRAVDAANDAAAAATNVTSKADDDGNDDNAQSLDHIKQKLNRLLGHKCSAPHTHSWGGRGHHNAMVCGLDDRTVYQLPLDESSVCVKIMFTNPTHREMVPCPYYLDGECRFADGDCRFSHGELVPFGELRDYREPNFQRLRRKRWPVLVKQPDRVWHKAHTVGVCDEAQRKVRLRLDESRREVTVEFGDVMPMHADSDGSDDDDDTADDDDGEEGVDSASTRVEDAAAADKASAMHRSALIEQSLLSVAPDRPLGEWEKHTRGFGSRMMQKYGYVLGTGLGSDGGGIVVPISAQVLPPGRSLDHCMALRDQANGDRNLFSVERRLNQQQRQQEQRNERAYEREAKRSSGADVFRFMNESVFAGLGAETSTSSSSGAASSSANGGRRSQGQARESYAEHSTKNLNVAGFQLGEDIRRKEQEVQKMSVSLERHQAGTTVHNRLKGQLDERQRELDQLRRSETIVRKEQSLRKDKSKLTIF